MKPTLSGSRRHDQRDPLYIMDGVNIPLSELSFSFSRSSGPGGQHVNTSDTRVTLSFDVAHSGSLTQLQRMIVNGKLKRRINKDGVLRLSCSSARSQKANREACVERFVRLLREALEPVLERIETRVPKSSKRKRLDRKKQRASIKKYRGRPNSSDW